MPTKKPASPAPAPPAEPAKTPAPVETPASTPTPKPGGLKGLAQAHAAEKPTADSATIGKTGPGRPAKSEEEKKATREAYNAKRREKGQGLNAPPARKPEQPALTDAEKKSRIQVNAAMMASTTLGLFSGFFGPKFADGATGQNDREILESGWVSYFTAKDIVNIPPVLALILSHTSYLLPRVSFRDLWAKAFPKKEKTIIDQKSAPSVHAAPAVKPSEILLYQEPVDNKPVPSGAPGAGQ